MDFRFIRLQSAIFTPDFNLGNSRSLIDWFLNAEPEIFNGECTSIPNVQGAPPEFPRIILQSKEKSWNLNISLTRTDLVFSSITQDSPTISIEEFTKISENLFSEYKNKDDILIQRLVLITERVALELDTAPAKYLSERFCKGGFIQGKDHPEGEGAFYNTKSFEIHNLKKYLHEGSGFDINSWVRVKATSLKGQEDQPVLFVHNDINTQPEKSTPEGFSAKDIQMYFTKIPGEIDQIIQLYFG